jgi:hypothetical protein
MAWMDRDALIAFADELAAFADDGARSEALTPDEREDLSQWAERLRDSVKSLADIVDLHDAAIMQGVVGGYPRGTAGPAGNAVACAISAAFTIGARAVRSQPPRI